MLSRNRRDALQGEIVVLQFDAAILCERSDEPAKRGIDVQTDVPAGCNLRKLLDRVFQAVHVIRDGTNDANGIAINESLQLLEVHVIVFVQFGYPDLDIKEVPAFMEVWVSCFRENDVRPRDPFRLEGFVAVGEHGHEHRFGPAVREDPEDFLRLTEQLACHPHDLGLHLPCRRENIVMHRVRV